MVDARARAFPFTRRRTHISHISEMVKMYECRRNLFVGEERRKRSKRTCEVKNEFMAIFRAVIVWVNSSTVLLLLLLLFCFCCILPEFVVVIWFVATHTKSHTPTHMVWALQRALHIATIQQSAAATAVATLHMMGYRWLRGCVLCIVCCVVGTEENSAVWPWPYYSSDIQHRALYACTGASYYKICKLYMQ